MQHRAVQPGLDQPTLDQRPQPYDMLFQQWMRAGLQLGVQGAAKQMLVGAHGLDQLEPPVTHIVFRAQPRQRRAHPVCLQRVGAVAGPDRLGNLALDRGRGARQAGGAAQGHQHIVAQRA